MSNKDWEVRDDWLESIRMQEMQVFKSLVNNERPTVIDLGCGKDKYLKHALSISNDNYIGLDIDESADIVCDITKFDLSTYKNIYTVSFGLLYLLDHQTQVDILNTMKHGVFQINRADTEDGHKLLAQDIEDGLTVYPWSNTILFFLDEFENYTVKETPVSYILGK